MKKMAHIVNGKVVAVSLWDGVSHWEPDEEVVELPVIKETDKKNGKTKTRVLGGIGWDYIDGQFLDNRPTPIGDDERLDETKEEE